MPHHDTSSKQDNPKLRANFFSKIFYWWLIPLFKYGRSHNLESKNLYKTMPDYLSERLGSNLERSWKRELADESNASLLSAIVKTFKWTFLKHAGYITILNIGIKILQPLSLSMLLRHFSPYSTSTRREGLACASLVVLLCVAHSLVANRFTGEAKLLALRARVALSSLIYRKIVRLSSSSASRSVGGTAINLLSNDVAKFDDIFVYFHYVWTMPLQIALVAYISWLEVGAVALLGIAMTVVQIVPIQAFCGRVASKLRLKIAVRTDRRIFLMSEIISGIRVVKMYSWEKPYELFASQARRYELSAITTALYLRGANWASAAFIKQTSLFFTILASVLLGERVSADGVFTMALYYHILQNTLGLFLPKAVGMLADVQISIRRIEKFLLLEEIKQDSTEIMIKKKSDQSVSVKEVEASWANNGNFKLHDVTLKIQPKKLCTVIGPVGAGKSSLLKLLLGELTPSSGEVLVNGSVSYSSQEPWLFGGSVKSNILFGQAYDGERYRRVIHACDLARDFEQLPHGENSLVGERGSALSGGQRARINLARAVYRDADVYLLDDPLSAVDVNVGKHLFEQCVNGLLRDKTRVLVTHQIRYLRSADLIVLLNKGRVEFKGNFQSFQNSQQLQNVSSLMQREDFGSRRSIPEIEEDRSLEIERSPNNNNSVGKAEAPRETEEFIVRGKMEKSLFWNYFRAGGSKCCLALLILCYVLAQLMISACDYWVAYWTKIEENRRNEFQNDTDASIESSTQPTTTVGGTPGIHLLIYVYAALIAVAVATSVAKNVLFYRICMNASQSIYDRMLACLLRAPLRFFETNPSGRILNRFSKDTGSVDEVLPVTMVEAAQIFCLLAGAVTQIVMINWWMSAYVAISMCLYWWIREVYLASARDIKRLEGIAKSPVLSHVNTSFSGILTIRSCHAESMSVQLFDERQDEHTATSYLFYETTMAFSLWLETTSIAFIACVTYSFVLFERSRQVFAGDVGLAVTQASLLSGLLQFAMRQTAEAVAQMTNVERMLQFTRLEQEGPFESDLGKELPKSWPENGTIQFDHLYLRYCNEDEPVLKNLNCTIKAGLKVGIVGRTGAGKSSLISALFRLSELDGKLFIDGVDTQSIGLLNLRKKITIIPQEPILFPVSLRDNLDPLHIYDDAMIWSTLEDVQLRPLFASLDQMLIGVNLSAGERQLLCLARAIIRRNKILVLDEATANADSRTDDLIRNIIRTKFSNCTVLTIAHRLNSVMDSDRILVMDNGEIVEYDHPHVLLQQDGSYFSKMVQ